MSDIDRRSDVKQTENPPKLPTTPVPSRHNVWAAPAPQVSFADTVRRGNARARTMAQQKRELQLSQAIQRAKSAQNVFSRVPSPAMALIMQYISVFELCTHQVYTSTRFGDAARESLKLERCVTVLWFSDIAKVLRQCPRVTRLRGSYYLSDKGRWENQPSRKELESRVRDDREWQKSSARVPVDTFVNAVSRALKDELPYLRELNLKLNQDPPQRECFNKFPMCPALTRLCITDVESLPQDFFTKFPSMTELHFELSYSYRDSRPTPEFRETVVNSLPNSLTSLTFGTFEPDISWFRALANSHPQLQRLDAWKSPMPVLEKIRLFRNLTEATVDLTNQEFRVHLRAHQVNAKALPLDAVRCGDLPMSPSITNLELMTDSRAIDVLPAFFSKLPSLRSLRLRERDYGNTDRSLEATERTFLLALPKCVAALGNLRSLFITRVTLPLLERDIEVFSLLKTVQSLHIQSLCLTPLQGGYMKSVHKRFERFLDAVSETSIEELDLRPYPTHEVTVEDFWKAMMFLATHKSLRLSHLGVNLERREHYRYPFFDRKYDAYQDNMAEKLATSLNSRRVAREYSMTYRYLDSLDSHLHQFYITTTNGKKYYSNHRTEG